VMTPDRDPVGTMLTQALRDIPDPPCDFRAARLELRQGMRRIAIRRRLTLGAVVSTAALLLLAVLQGLPRSDSSLPPAQRLPSGLPVGTLTGKLHTTLRLPDGTVRYRAFRLVVRPDGTGTYDPLESETDQGYMHWPVRYVGGVPGRVTLKRHSAICGNDDNELSLEFTRSGNSVTITRSVTGGCTSVTMAGVNLRGVVLRVQR
jgi:hypothetical protein